MKNLRLIKKHSRYDCLNVQTKLTSAHGDWDRKTPNNRTRRAKKLYLCSVKLIFNKL